MEELKETVQAGERKIERWEQANRPRDQVTTQQGKRGGGALLVLKRKSIEVKFDIDKKHNCDKLL